MTYLYKTYLCVKDYAQANNLMLEYGLYSNSTKNAEYVAENVFYNELNKYNYIILKYKADFYIAICNKQLFKESSLLNKLNATTLNRKEMLIIYEHELDQKKLKMFLDEYKPIVNAISIQAFIYNLSHISLPVKIKVIDFETENNMLMLTKKNLSEINFNDPVVAYKRLKPGQVLEITDYSPTSGYNISYRIII